MISVYDIQQPVQQPVSFSLEARVGYEGVVAGYEGEGDVVWVGALRGIRWLCVHWVECSIYPRVRNARRLYQDDLLEELDATYPHTGRSCIHSSQDVGLDAGHELPFLRIAGVGDTDTCKYKNVFA